jgi:hypothetical protein
MKSYAHSPEPGGPTFAFVSQPLIISTSSVEECGLKRGGCSCTINGSLDGPTLLAAAMMMCMNLRKIVQARAPVAIELFAIRVTYQFEINPVAFPDFYQGFRSSSV